MDALRLAPPSKMLSYISTRAIACVTDWQPSLIHLNLSSRLIDLYNWLSASMS
ncbi:hypothetical protein DPMN_099239 [Dreissena polymorpha]|uniref:Uncharacterized protein n=1 Tax=Dreissena polymorpha TaxID=45954 RepID=A0A9D4LG40_DREPO|nr:hypothetical protein DPMN_099239 [Dreissena polymorpha]